MKYQIEKATENDLETILQIQKKAYIQEAEIYNDYSIQPMTQPIEDVIAEWKAGTILKAVAEGKILGSVRAYKEGDTCKIGKLIVAPSYQNCGIGKALLQAIEKQYADSEYFELFTGHRSQKNLSIYQSLGYTPYNTEQVEEHLAFVFLRKKRKS